MISYFAYGSNLDEGQMKERCPSSKIVGVFVLKEYKLIFSIFSPKRQCGCADIVKSPGDEVWGIVYEITEDDLERLDAFEAHPHKYKRFTVKVRDALGNEKEAESYEVVEKSSVHLPPSQAYYNILLHAAQRYHFPDAYCKYLASFEVLDH